DEQTRASLEQALGDRQRMAWALEGADPFAAAAIFPNAYHIKVAVRDPKAFWLSSGNWNNSNQPDIEPVHTPGELPTTAQADRDWHVVVEHDALSDTFATYLEHDLEGAAEHQTSPPAAQALTEDPAVANVLAALAPAATAL